MKINIYYEFPVYYLNNDELCDDSNIRELWVVNFINIANGLIKKYPHIKFEKKHRWGGNANPWSPEMNIPFDKFKHARMSHSIMIIENDENKKYFIISVWDHLDGEIRPWYDLKEKCVEIFAALGCHSSIDRYKIMDLKYTSLNLTSTISGEEKAINEFYYENLEKNNRIMPEKLFFYTSSLYGIREYLFNLKNENFDIRCSQHLPNPGYLQIKDFVGKLSEYKINIDLDGAIELSARTPIILGLGTCLIKNKMIHQFHDPLIPDYHYASFEIEPYDSHQNYINGIIKKFNELKSKPDLVEFISKNARDYWEKNCSNQNYVQLVLNLMDLNKLV